jgi:hypothetical protein
MIPQDPLQAQDFVAQFKIAFTPIGRPAAHGAEVTNLNYNIPTPHGYNTSYCKSHWKAIRFGLIRGGHVAEATASGVESRSTRFF